MNALQLKFNLNLKENEIGLGILFHRWIPDGLKDVIILDTEEKDIKIDLIMERFGITRNNIIEFSPDQKKVDQEFMNKQAIIEEGILTGIMIIPSLSSDELKVLNERNTKDDIYIKFIIETH